MWDLNCFQEGRHHYYFHICSYISRRTPVPPPPHLIHCENTDPLAAQPLVKLRTPVLHKAARCNHKDTLSNWLPTIRPLLQQCPGQCHALEGLPQSHLISQDGTVPTHSSEIHTQQTHRDDLWGITIIAVIKLLWGRNWIILRLFKQYWEHFTGIILSPHAHDTLIEEEQAVSLVRPQVSGQVWVKHNINYRKSWLVVRPLVVGGGTRHHQCTWGCTYTKYHK